MAGDAPGGLIRVVYVERVSAVMLAAGVVLAETVLLALIGTAHRCELLIVGTLAMGLVSLALLPLWFRLPARSRREYEHAVRLENVTESPTGQEAARRLALRRTAAFAGVSACWLLLIGLASKEVMPPLMLVPLSLSQWARSRATADWERANGAAMWQPAPRMFGSRGPLVRGPYCGAGTGVR